MSYVIISNSSKSVSRNLDSTVPLSGTTNNLYITMLFLCLTCILHVFHYLVLGLWFICTMTHLSTDLACYSLLMFGNNL